MRSRLGLLVVPVAIGAALALGGCSAGQISQMGTQVAAVNGASGDVGHIALRDASLAYPAGDVYLAGANALLTVNFANSGSTADELVSVTSPLASGVTITGSTSIIAFGSLVAGRDEDGNPATNPSSSAKSAPLSSAQNSAASKSSGETTPTVATPTTSAPAAIVVGKVRITLTGLTQAIRPGQTLPITFTFATAGTVTVQVPIGNNTAEVVETTGTTQ